MQENYQSAPSLDNVSAAAEVINPKRISNKDIFDLTGFLFISNLVLKLYCISFAATIAEITETFQEF